MQSIETSYKRIWRQGSFNLLNIYAPVQIYLYFERKYKQIDKCNSLNFFCVNLRFKLFPARHLPTKIV